MLSKSTFDIDIIHVFFSCFYRFSLVLLDPRGRLGGLGVKAGSACEEFEDSEGGILG